MRRQFRNHLSPENQRSIHRFRLNPPQSIRSFAESLGVAVVEVDLDGDHFGYLEQRPELGSPSGYVIFINSSLSNAEKRWAVAHELGHYFLHRGRREFGFDSAIHLSMKNDDYFLIGDEEQEAENFAEDLFFGGGALEAFATLHGTNAEVLASRVFGVPVRKVQRAMNFYEKYRDLKPNSSRAS